MGKESLMGKKNVSQQKKKISLTTKESFSQQNKEKVKNYSD